MKKIYVVFCDKNLHRPLIYHTLPAALKKVKTHPSFQYLSFKSSIEAEQFVHPKVIQYLEVEQQYKKKGIDLQKQSNKERNNMREKMGGSKNNHKHKLMEACEMVQKQVQQFAREGEVGWLITAFYPGKQIYAQTNWKQFCQHLGACRPIAKKLYFSSANSGKVQAIRAEKFDISILFGEDEEVNDQMERIYDEILKYQPLVSTPIGSEIQASEEHIALIAAHSSPRSLKSGIGYLVASHSNEQVFTKKLNIGVQTRASAHYLALICCLIECYCWKIKKLKIFLDNQAIVKSIEFGKIVNEQVLSKHYFVGKLIQQFEKVKFELIDSSLNFKAKEFAERASKEKKQL